MNVVKLILRSNDSTFFSIENVFVTLKPHLNASIVELPWISKGVINRLKNIFFILRLKNSIIHITGHDHYLLWWPFKKSILTIHDVEALKRKKVIKKWIFKKLWFDIPISNAKYVTTISDFSKKELLSIGNYKTPIEVIPNPLTIEIVYEPKLLWSEELKILHIGTKANKNLNRLLESLQGLTCELTIIGKLSKAQLAKLSEYSISYISKSNVSSEELIMEYKNTDLLAFVSTYEGFGLPIIEAQAAGRVVLTSNVASMPEVAGKGALLVNPFSVNEIKEGILKLINDAELRESLIAQGHANVQRFNPSAIAQQYTDLYNTVLND